MYAHAHRQRRQLLSDGERLELRDEPGRCGGGGVVNELFEPGEMVWIDDTIANIVEDLGGDALDVIINGKPMLVTRREIERIQPDPEEQPYDGPPDGFGYPGWR